MLNMGICEDSSIYLAIIKKQILILLQKNGRFAKIFTYHNGKQLLYDIEDGKHFDIIISDIEMPEMDGIVLAGKIRTYLPETVIIFVTSYIKYAPQAFELDIFRYIPKAELNEKLPQAMHDVLKYLKIQENKYYLIETIKKVQKISYKEIIYIYREGKNAIFLLRNDKKVKVRNSLIKIYAGLDKEEFCFLDRSNIINLSFIVGIKDYEVSLEGDIRIDIPVTRAQVLRDNIRDFWERQL